MQMDHVIECQNVNKGEMIMVGIIMLGATNSGKSTIAKFVSNNLGIRYISSGDIARQMNVDDELAKGKLAPEDEMRNRIFSAIYENDRPFILDGFPRFLDQYKWLKSAIKCDMIFIQISVPDRHLLQRAINRNRNDDNVDAVLEKVKFWYKETVPMINDILYEGEIVHNINNANGTNVGRNMKAVNDIVKKFLKEEGLC